jgi:hypothetical protein
VGGGETAPGAGGTRKAEGEGGQRRERRGGGGGGDAPKKHPMPKLIILIMITLTNHNVISTLLDSANSRNKVSIKVILKVVGF